MTWQTVERTEHGEGIVRISLDRPEKHNVQTPEMIDEFLELLDELEDDDETRVVVIDGNGPSFSAGHALNEEMLEERAQQWRTEDFLEFEEAYYYGPCMRLRDTDLPTIAQVHGHCTAAGMMMASMCDLIVAAEDTQFSNPVNRMAASGVEILFEPWDLGFRKAKEFLWTGDTIDGTEAEEFGLANHAVPADELDEKTMTLATKIARMPPHSIKLSKRSFRYTADQMGQEASFKYHMYAHQLQHLSREYQEWREEAQQVLQKDGFGGWLTHRDEPFQLEDL